MSGSPVFTGLCASCRHHEWIRSGRGSRFLRCGLSFRDPAFPRYPVLPVLSCRGHDPTDPPDPADPREEGEEP